MDRAILERNAPACTTKIANRFSILESDVEAMIKDLLDSHKDCRGLNADECSNYPFCVNYEQKCMLARIPNADIINENPENFANGLNDIMLENLLKLAAFMYYNGPGSGLSDNAFDAIEYIYYKRKRVHGQNERAFSKIGAPPIPRIRTRLPFSMSSLRKVKPEESSCLTFINEGKGELVVSDKLDGVSAMVEYNDGIPVNLFTRGDGFDGGNVTYLLPHLPNIPARLDGSVKNLYIRGELIIPRQAWFDNYRARAANARSLVSSIVNSGHLDLKVMPGIRFVAYQVVAWSNGDVVGSPSDQLRLLDKLGFTVVPHVKLSDVMVMQLVDLYKRRRTESEYFIDGLVFAHNFPEVAPPRLPSGAAPIDAVRPTNRIAFKMMLEEQIRETQIESIDWKISRYGRYFPVAVFRPIYVDGHRITRASAHNAGYIREWNLGPGTKIKVVRSGDVIPRIIEPVMDIAVLTQYPDGKYKWQWDRNDIILSQIEGNPEVMVQRMLHFFSTLAVPRLGEKTLEKLFEAGHKTSGIVTNLSIPQLKMIRGIGDKIAKTIFEAIHERLHTVPIDRYIVALTSDHGRNIGRRIVKIISRIYPRFIEWSTDKLMIELAALTSPKSPMKIPYFGDKKLSNLAMAVPGFYQELLTLGNGEIRQTIDYHEARLKSIKLNKLVKDKIFIFSGFMNDISYDLEDYIYDHLAEIGSSVTSSTECVVIANPAVQTTKMEEAKTLGKPIYIMDEFLSKYKIQISKEVEAEEEPVL